MGHPLTIPKLIGEVRQGLTGANAKLGEVYVRDQIRDRLVRLHPGDESGSLSHGEEVRALLVIAEGQIGEANANIQSASQVLAELVELLNGGAG